MAGRCAPGHHHQVAGPQFSQVLSEQLAERIADDMENIIVKTRKPCTQALATFLFLVTVTYSKHST